MLIMTPLVPMLIMTPLYPMPLMETALIMETVLAFFSTNNSLQRRKKSMLDIMHATPNSTETVLIIETVLIMFRKVLAVLQ